MLFAIFSRFPFVNTAFCWCTVTYWIYCLIWTLMFGTCRNLLITRVYNRHFTIWKSWLIERNEIIELRSNCQWPYYLNFAVGFILKTMICHLRFERWWHVWTWYIDRKYNIINFYQSSEKKMEKKRSVRFSIISAFQGS